VGLCFHPEIAGDAGLHAWFLSDVAGLTIAPGAAVRPADGARR
jgi:hypothetical protein